MDNEDEVDRMRARRKRSESSRVRGKSRHTTERSSQAQDHIEASRGDRTYYSTGDGRNPRVRYSGQQNAKNRKKKKRHHKKHKIIFKLLVIAALLIAGLFLFKQRTHQKGYWTIAIFGVDSRDGKLDKGALSDVEMLCNINKETGEIKLVSVYRDTYLKINSKGTYHKINEAYFKGGHKQALEALNENLDLNIDDYATFNWKSVADAINILGGIDLEITDSEFAYINGFITETVNSTGVGSHQLKHAGMNHLDGAQAVAYARLRLMDTDFNRTERQRKVVNLAMEKARSADFATRKTLVTAVFPQISTSIGMNDILAVAKGISKYRIGETDGFPFSRTTMKIGKMDCVIPATLESNVVQLHQFLYGQENYTPSAAVKKISQSISKESGISKPGQKASSGGTSNSKKKKKQTAAAPAETTPAQTEAAVETTEETKETAADTTAVETKEQQYGEKPTQEDGSLVGPGAKIPDTKETDKKVPDTKEDDTTSETKKQAGSEKGSDEGVTTEPETNAGPDA
ncbi:LCP family protein [Lacrimispora amygdalina]|uniref:LCP family protein n=1 Tax=Lacrimispora amygdalina TaxID=253257 RepID=UPI000BE40DB2|nr:LCP family protein [Lacrimispora amygdalina]